MIDIFSTYHPLVNFSYFSFIFIFSMVFMHPVCLTITLISAFIYSASLNGKKAIKRNLTIILPTILVTALINPAFNHEGITILTYLPNGNPLTLESIVYGVAAATMLAAVITWFTCYNKIMTSDKFIYLFGRIIPALSLVLSMSLRFIPKFKTQINIVSNAQKSIGNDVSSGNIFKRAKHGITILSIMITWSLENAIETADSMKSRGYGLPGRTAFSIYQIEGKDKKALITIVLLGTYVLLGGLVGKFKWRYFPSIKGARTGLYTISLWITYITLCLIPIIINRREEKRWKATQSKI